MSSDDKERLLARWSRLKREATQRRGDESPAPQGEAAATVSGQSVKSGRDQASERPGAAMPDLPAIDALNADSDFQAFMDPRVDDDVRRAALKTLFRHPDFNVTDGLDVYAEDYTKLERLTPAMVAALKYAQRTVLAEREPNDNQFNDSRTGVVEEKPLAQGGGDAGPVMSSQHADGSGTEVSDIAAGVSRQNQITVNESEAEQALSSSTHPRTRTN